MQQEERGWVASDRILRSQTISLAGYIPPPGTSRIFPDHSRPAFSALSKRKANAGFSDETDCLAYHNRSCRWKWRPRPRLVPFRTGPLFLDRFSWIVEVRFLLVLPPIVVRFLRASLPEWICSPFSLHGVFAGSLVRDSVCVLRILVFGIWRLRGCLMTMVGRMARRRSRVRGGIVGVEVVIHGEPASLYSV